MASIVTQRHNAKAVASKAGTVGSAGSESESENRQEEKSSCKTKITKEKQFRLLDLLEGIGGTVNFSFFKAPGWVDLSLPAGTTSELPLNLEHPKLWSILSGHSLVFSPNLVWLLITALVYFFEPYDFEVARTEGWWRPEWFTRRAIINISITLVYYGYWHTVLYGLGWASRPFAQDRVYRWSKTIHNIWYTTLGTIQWTAWEMIMVHLYSTGRIGYQSDKEIFSSFSGFLNFFACCISVPVYREIHFFFAHRLIHCRFLYKYIHSLHHRNTDVEPFSGMCMSPSEHLYYISSVGPSFFWHASPFQFLWNGIHLVLSPGASHSGWEDHWHSDQFHCAHHRYFECNYGTPDMPLDRWFGCFRETMAPTTKVYQGEAVECVSKEGSPIIKARADSKSTLVGLPVWDQMLYMTATGVGLPYFVGCAAFARDGNSGSLPFYFQAWFAAFIVSLGPVILAFLLSLATASPPVTSWESFRSTMLYPYHKDNLFGRLGITLLAGNLFSVIPTYVFFHSLFVKDPEDTIYNRIWSN